MPEHEQTNLFPPADDDANLASLEREHLPQVLRQEKQTEGSRPDPRYVVIEEGVFDSRDISNEERERSRKRSDQHRQKIRQLLYGNDPPDLQLESK